MPDPTSLDSVCLGCMREMNSPGVCPHCGCDAAGYEAPVHQLRPGSILNGKYLVGRSLGEGGFGITYIGFDLNLELRVAIKEYYPNGLVTRQVGGTMSVISFTTQGEQYGKGLDRFVQEARSLAKFYDLSGIVSVKDFFRENGTAYIVMEYIEGETLKQYLARKGGRLPSEEALLILRPVMESLALVHGAGIIHRDISPDNIMLTRRGAKLIDFGAARTYVDEENRSRTVTLKSGYAPYEQYQTRGEQGPWTDVYALCATIYKCVTGETPPEATERVVEDALTPPAGVDAPAREALVKGLAVLKKNRYQDIPQLMAALYAEGAQPENKSVWSEAEKTAAPKARHKEGNGPCPAEQDAKPQPGPQSAPGVEPLPETKKSLLKQKILPWAMGLPGILFVGLSLVSMFYSFSVEGLMALLIGSPLVVLAIIKANKWPALKSAQPYATGLLAVALLVFAFGPKMGAAFTVINIGIGLTLVVIAVAKGMKKPSARAALLTWALGALRVFLIAYAVWFIFNGEKAGDVPLSMLFALILIVIAIALPNPRKEAASNGEAKPRSDPQPAPDLRSLRQKMLPWALGVPGVLFIILACVFLFKYSFSLGTVAFSLMGVPLILLGLIQSNKYPALKKAQAYVIGLQATALFLFAAGSAMDMAFAIINIGAGLNLVVLAVAKRMKTPAAKTALLPWALGVLRVFLAADAGWFAVNGEKAGDVALSIIFAVILAVIVIALPNPRKEAAPQ